MKQLIGRIGNCICNIVNVWSLYTWRTAGHVHGLASRPNPAKPSTGEISHYIKWWALHQYCTLLSFEWVSEEIWSRRTPFITDLESSLCSWWFAQGSSSFCARLWTTCLWSSFVVQAVTLQRGRLPQCSWRLHWLILAPALERIKKRWEDARAFSWCMLLTNQSIRRFYPKTKSSCKLLEHSRMTLIDCFRCRFWFEWLPYSLDFSLCFREKGHLATYFSWISKNALCSYGEIS